MADHEDLFAAAAGLDDAGLADFFGNSDDPSSAVDSNHHNLNHNPSHPDASSSRTSNSPAAGQAVGAATTNPQSLPSGTAAPGIPFYQTADSTWSSFEDTPPYDDAYESPWQPGAPFTAHQHHHHNQQQQQLPQRGLPPQHPGNQNQQLTPADVSPIALQAEPLIIPPAPAGHVRPNPAPEVLQTLTPDQQERLKNIAMPAHLQYHSPQSEPSPQSSPSDKDKGESISSPEAAEPSKTSSRKRKSSADDDDDDDDDDGAQPVKKTAHNMIEKRYRTNLNDKIAALRDSVPSLRIMSKSARGEDTTEDREELHGLTPAHKLNKATVLSKATEYIRHLEKRNNRLMHENDSMQQRISAFEKLFMAGAMNGTMSPLQQQPPTPIQFPQDAQAFMGSPMPTPGGAQDPPGMIPVPDDMKRIIQAQVAAGRPYPIGPQANYQQNAAMLRQQQIQQQQQQIQQGRWGQTAPYFGKMMVGSLAGLLIVEAVRESETSNESPDGRGLFAAPIQLINSFVSTSHFSVAGYSFSAVQLMSSLKLFLLFGSLLYVFVPALFSAAAPKPQKTRQQTRASLSAVPSLASPIHVRRQAWLTAIQTVWVPRHNFILEAAALMLKTMKLSLRNTIGVKQYQALTGLTEEQEAARVKAWTIALDAQLAGGDVEINKSRLTLTLLASGTLPDTPLRLMLKALHIRVLLWQLGQSGVHNVVAAKLARANWNQAKQLHRLSKASSRTSSPSSSPRLSAQGQQVPSDDSLPDHLAVLLEQECDDVLNDDVVQRAHNLAWNRPTTHDVAADIDGMNAVVEDPAIKSPMDAVAAWWSSLVLHQVLVTSLDGATAVTSEKGEEESKQGPSTISVNEDDLALAAKVAPVGSNAQVRATRPTAAWCRP
ncbi:hypothetical protein MAPG_07524 [Magnaporthiopsis poae ATCC 64411]|uniref:BHLH domain-containing protein n=1 Tax=Magnaporthiopsis poae (strain ATCC 64411 / 73-15) TaxID=644358 RepID=A0A0C4E4X0_MAGP6|nr:hypothetical protein MAPG_07524 [Magnaporthiopsis poae ATCC 64411]